MLCKPQMTVSDELFEADVVGRTRFYRCAEHVLSLTSDCRSLRRGYRLRFVVVESAVHKSSDQGVSRVCRERTPDDSQLTQMVEASSCNMVDVNLQRQIRLHK